MTGRGAGSCAGNDMPDGAKFGPRRRFGRRLGWEGGRGRRFRFRGSGKRGRAWFNFDPAPQTKNRDQEAQ